MERSKDGTTLTYLCVCVYAHVYARTHACVCVCLCDSMYVRHGRLLLLYTHLRRTPAGGGRADTPAGGGQTGTPAGGILQGGGGMRTCLRHGRGKARREPRSGGRKDAPTFWSDAGTYFYSTCLTRSSELRLKPAYFFEARLL
jgi:hypothetical protein